MTMDGVALTLLIILPLLLPGKISSIPPPVNVTVSCHNFQTVVYWNYSQPSVNTRFTVDISSYGGGPQPVHHCVNTTNYYCNISSLVLHELQESYSYRVKAAEGSNESASTNHLEFTYNTNRVEDVLCSLDFPPVSLWVSQGPKVLTLRFLHPFHLYKAALRHDRNKKDYKLFEYDVLVGKEGVRHPFTCMATKEQCEQSISLAEEDTTHCVILEGMMNNLNVTAAERICHEPQKISEKMNAWYIVLYAVVPFVIIGVVAVFGLLLFKKQTEDRSSFPKFLVSVFSQRSALLNPESEVTSEVQTLGPSPCGSVLQLPADCDSSEAPAPGEGSRFRIGRDTEGQSLGTSCFSGSVGSEQGGRADEEQGEGLSGIRSSGYDRPQILVELSPGEQVEGYRPTQLL